MEYSYENKIKSQEEEIARLNKEILKRDNVINLLTSVLEMVKTDANIKTQQLDFLIGKMKNHDYNYFDTKFKIDSDKFEENTIDCSVGLNKTLNTIFPQGSKLSKKEELTENNRIIQVGSKIPQINEIDLIKKKKKSQKICIPNIRTGFNQIIFDEKVSPERHEISIEETKEIERKNSLINLKIPSHEYISFYIMNYLTPADMINLSMVNKDFYTLSKNNNFWDKLYFKENSIFLFFDENDNCRVLENAKEKYNDLNKEYKDFPINCELILNKKRSQWIDLKTGNFSPNNETISSAKNLRETDKNNYSEDSCQSKNKTTIEFSEFLKSESNSQNNLLEKKFFYNCDFMKKYFEINRIKKNWIYRRPIVTTISTSECTTALNLNTFNNELISTSTDGSATLYKLYSYRKIYGSLEDPQLYMQHHKQTKICDKSINFLGHSGPIWCIDRDDDLLFTGSYDKTIKLWEISTGVCINTFRAHTNWVSSVFYDKSYNMLLSSSFDSTIKLWEIANFSINNSLILQGENGNFIHCIKGNLNEGEVISGTEFRTVDIWDINKVVKKSSLFGHLERINNIKICIENNLILSGSEDKSIRIWDMRTNECEMILTGHKRGITQVEIDRINNRVISSSMDKTIKLWDIRKNKEIRELVGHSSSVTSFAYDETKIISGSKDNSIRIWNFLN